MGWKEIYFPQCNTINRQKSLIFNYEITYNISFDSILINGDTIHIDKDTSIALDFEVEIDLTLDKMNDTFDVTYWNRDIEIHYNKKKSV